MSPVIRPQRHQVAILAEKLSRMTREVGLRETSGALLIDTEGHFLFQRRDDVPTILYPGKIALFGGHREKEESFLECIVREVNEEIGYHVPGRAFEHLGEFRNVHPDGSIGFCQVFVARGIPKANLAITEGTLIVVSHADLAGLAGQITPTVAAAVAMFERRFGTPMSSHA